MKTQEQIINQGKVSNFDEFLTENRKAINKQFALAMRVLVLLGPIIAIMVKLNMFISGAREQYISVGFTDYLTKPINPELLEEMLIEMLPKEKITLIENK